LEAVDLKVEGLDAAFFDVVADIVGWWCLGEGGDGRTFLRSSRSAPRVDGAHQAVIALGCIHSGR